MVHTLPDYTTKYKLVKVFANIDNAELAARLGSISTEDRRGNMIWYDNFEDNINKWVTNTTGSGGSIALSTDQAHDGTKSVKLVTGNIAGNTATMIKYMNYTELTKMGFEIRHTLNSSIKHIVQAIYIFTGTTMYHAATKTDIQNNRLQILKQDGTWETIETGHTFYFAQSLFDYSKIVVDPQTGKYERWIYNNKTHVLNTYNMQSTADTTGAHIEYWFEITTNTNSNEEIYADAFIVTRNEP